MILKTLKKNTTFDDLVDISKNQTASREYDCNIVLDIDDKKHLAYGVYIGYRELTFYTDNFTATYLVDSYGYNDYVELFEINE